MHRAGIGCLDEVYEIYEVYYVCDKSLETWKQTLYGDFIFFLNLKLAQQSFLTRAKISVVGHLDWVALFHVVILGFHLF